MVKRSLPKVVIVEPDDLQALLLGRLLKRIKSFEWRLYVDLLNAAKEMDILGVANLVVLPVHGESATLAEIRAILIGAANHEEPQGVQFARALRAEYPQVPIMFYTGSAETPSLVTEFPHNTFQLQRVLTALEFEAAVLDALRKTASGSPG